MISQMFPTIFVLFFMWWCCTAIGAIEWGPCPPEQSVGASFTIDCANISYPLNYNDPSMGSVNAFVRRMYATNPTNSTLWLVAGGPGDSTRLFVYICDYFLAINQSYTCYTQDARGTGLSSYLSCGKNQPTGPFNPYNATSISVYSKCIQQIIAEYGSVLQYYSTYNAQMDLLNTVLQVNPALVHIYAQSYGTYALNTYLQLPGARADAVVLDGPVPPNRWPLENNAEWTSQVAQDVAYGCVSNSSVCSDRMSVMAHIPKLVMDSIIDGTLPCLKKLAWLNATDGQFWTSVYNNYCTGGASLATAHICLAPFWFRLHRCSASDVTQLNFFHNYQQGVQFNPQNWLDYAFGLALNIGSSELYSYSHRPLDYTMQVQRSARMFSDSGVEMLIAYARNVSGIPLYQVNSSVYMKFAVPQVPILILVGTYDANTENGLGFWFQEGLGNQSTLLNVPYNSHVTLAEDNPCVDGIVLEFFNSLGTSYDTSCLNYVPMPDWDGSTEAVQSFSQQIFGTTDLWNDNYAVDVPAKNNCPEVVTVTAASSDCQCHTAAVVSGIVVPLCVIIIALAAYCFILHQKLTNSPMSKTENN